MEVAVFVAIFFAIFLPLFFAVTPSRADEEKTRERRMAAHRMSARLLRMDI
jgi:hypothetical protein